MTAHSIREAVARAICTANRADPDEIDELRGGYGLPVYVPMWQHYLEDADAALAVALPIIREHHARLAEDLAPQPDGAPDDTFDPKCQEPYLEVAAAIRADEGPK